MFAVSRDDQKLFVHQPDAGLAVPVVADTGSSSLAIGMPSVTELEGEFAVYDDASEVVAAHGQAVGAVLSRAMELSRSLSEKHGAMLANGSITPGELKRLEGGAR